MSRIASGILGALLSLAACQTEAPTALDSTLALTAVEPAASAPGQVVRLRGNGFHTHAAENLVLFEGVRGHVRSASETLLEVEVPSCLPSRSVSVVVAVDSSSTIPLSMDVLGNGPPATLLAVGEDREVQVLDGTECVKLGGDATYLVVVQSVGTVAGASYPYSLRGLSSSSSRAAQQSVVGLRALDGRRDPEGSWKLELRRRESDALSRYAGVTPVGSRSGAAPVPPRVGDERRFQVLDGGGSFREVRASARWVSDRVVIYEDAETGAGGLSTDDVGALARDFDDPVFAVVTGAFGDTPDLDGNERVVVLLTPAVNRLTPPEASGFVGGFFFGVDLLPGAANSNGGEILYALVPDPTGRFGPPHSQQQVMQVLPSILAHEFQHLVHYHQRMRVRGADRNEAVWISEALAQNAEVLVADTLAKRGRASDASLYLEPTLRRAREFIVAPGDVSLLITVGAGTLAERGAGWLFLRYLQGHYGGLELLRSLTWSTKTGIENVEAATGRGWTPLYSDWSVANFADGIAGFPNPALQYPDLEIREALSAGDSTYPLTPTSLIREFAHQGARLSGSTEYFVLRAAGAEAVSVRLADPSGGAPPSEARLRLRVVRIE